MVEFGTNRKHVYYFLLVLSCRISEIL